MRDEESLTPLPKKLFSLTAKPIVPPSEPTPAPRLISPVGFSSTLISIILVEGLDPSFNSVLTDLKIFKDLILFKLLACNNSLYGSPSSISNSLLTTLSSVILLPRILIFST